MDLKAANAALVKIQARDRAFPESVRPDDDGLGSDGEAEGSTGLGQVGRGHRAFHGVLDADSG